jgi:uncharacterized RDD family membrane protein YckC
MNQPPIGPDPHATQPIPAAPASPLPLAYAHRFGSVPFYLIARLLACAIDGIALAFVIAAFAFNALEPGGASIFSRRDEGAFGTLALVAFGGAFALAFVCEGLFGTTLGKSLFGLRVRRTDGRHAGVGRVLVRALLRPIDVLLVGPILALVTPRHQRLGDLASGAVVAQSRVGPLASLIAIVLLGGLAYAQIVFGGGLTSALGISAEAAAFGPDVVTKAGALVGLAIPRVSLPAIPVPVALPSPSPSASPVQSATAPAFSDESPEPAVATPPETADPAPDASEPAPEESAPTPEATDATGV